MTELTEEQYDKNYKVGEEFLIHIAEKNGWIQNEIFEESESQGEGYKYGLTLVGYEDEEHEIEAGIITIDLANLDEFIPKCIQCGTYITGNTCQNEQEDVICEECLIHNTAKNKGLVHD